jgi:vitamin B12 transporter
MYPRCTFAAGTLALLAALPSLAAETETAAVVVTATRQAMRANELLSDVTVIGQEEIQKAGPSSTVAELLSRQPGIEMSRNGNLGSQTDIRIRGTNGNHTLLMIDGMRVGSASSGAANWSRIPLSEIDRIEVLRGPSSSLYGNDAIGGVVQIFTRQGDGPARISVEGGVGSQGTTDGSVGISGSADGWRYSFNTASRRTDGFSNVSNTTAKNYNADRDGYANQSTSGSLSYTPAKGHEMGVSLFNSAGRNRYDSGSGATASKDYQNQGDVTSYSAYSKNTLSSIWKSTLRAGRSDDDSTNYTDAKVTSVFHTQQNQFSWQNDFKLPGGNALLALERLEQSVKGSGNYSTTSRTIDSLLAGWNGRFDSHRLQINGRRDNNSQFGAKNTGNAAYGLQLSDNWEAHASVGTAYKAPTFNDLYYPLDANGYVGNSSLKAESSRNGEVALQFEQAGHRASTTYYRNKVSDLISWSGRLTPVNVGQATLEGLTLAYTGQLAGLDIGSSFDWQSATDDSTGQMLARRARERGTLSVGKNFGTWDVRGEIAAVGRRFDTDYNPASPQRNVLGGYSLFNLYASHTVSRDVSLFTRADNVFGKKYEQAYNYATPGASIFIGLRYTPSL